MPEDYRPTHAHTAYIYSLRQANLAETALGRDWIAVSEDSLQNAVEIRPPFEEVFYASAAEAFAQGYRFSVQSGQRIELEVDFQGRQPGRLFVDLFRVIEGDAGGFWLVASANEGGNRLEFEARHDNQYVVRLQPELLRGGQYKVVIRNVASLGFPVSGRSSRSIQSGFGEPRDGGRREHHGVDIFAPRHTPVVAPTRAYVRNVGESNLGGRVVWLRDEKRSLNLYFAHLQTQEVKPGTWVDAGQIIGTVGNSGNARTTRPHLHFGIYARGEGPVDPYYFIAETDTVAPVLSSDLKALGHWVRSNVEPVALRFAWGSQRRPPATLNRHLPMKVLAAAGSMYRVSLPDGGSGYVPERSVEPADGALEEQTASVTQAVRETPEVRAATIEWIRIGDEFTILGQYAEFWLVRTQNGHTGWLPIPSG